MIDNWLKGLYNQFMRWKLPQYMRRFTTMIRRNTIGRFQAKALSAQNNLDKKVYGAQNKMMGRMGNSRQMGGGPAGPTGRSGPPARMGGGGMGSQKQAPMSPAEAAAARRRQQQGGGGHNNQ